jgi:DNA-binding YbaB/EbfC family protein
MKQAQQMQEKLKEEMGSTVVEASVGGGMVTVKMNGLKQVLSIGIDPEVMDPADPAMLQDLLAAAVNEAGRRVDEELQGRMGSLAGGLPGMV